MLGVRVSVRVSVETPRVRYAWKRRAPNEMFGLLSASNAVILRNNDVFVQFSFGPNILYSFGSTAQRARHQVSM